MLECAIDTFLEHGYEQTTILKIANTLGMSKRTVYAYYKDKEELFKAAVRRLIDRYTVPIETLKAVESDDLEATLIAVARIRISNVATPSGIKLQRIISAQSYRFPELLHASFEISAGPTIRFLSNLFQRLNKEGLVQISDTELAAVSFLSLVVGGPARAIVSGDQLNDEVLNTRVAFTVQLFLNGIRPR